MTVGSIADAVGARAGAAGVDAYGAESAVAGVDAYPAEGAANIAIVTLGCAKNEVDSDKMRARLLGSGHNLVDDADSADFVILNTCAFITEATEEAINMIFELLDLPRLSDGSAKLVVSGCMPSRYGDELRSGLPEVAAFVSCADEHNIVSVIDSMIVDMDGSAAGREPSAVVGDASPALAGAPHRTPSTSQCTVGHTDPEPPNPAHRTQSTYPAMATRTHGAAWAYLKIADGCDRRCSFCTIPGIKGAYRSLPSAEIVREAAELVQGGARELVLIAQDTTLWGQDLAGQDISGQGIADELPDLAALLELLASRFPDTWIRVMYAQPQGISDGLLAVMARHDNICNYLDIPLQHASARVLREMSRSGDGQSYLRLLARIRAALPDAALRTTLIAGFPGESRAESRELERFVEQAGFDYVGVFAYSPEDGTPASARDDQVPVRTRRARAQRLRDLADSLGFTKAAERLDRLEEVLVCEYDEDGGGDGDGSGYYMLGRSKRQAPEVDGMVHLDGGSIGELVMARIVDCYCYDMDGRLVKADRELARTDREGS